MPSRSQNPLAQTMAVAEAYPLPYPMQCLEVWGGHGTTATRLSRPGLDVWVSSHSHDQADGGGGDLHLISSCASGRITRWVLADICGLGPQFADLAGNFRTLLKQNVNRPRQARLVRQMNCRLGEAAEQGGFASTLVGTYFAPTRSLSLCNAGHPSPFLYRAERGWSILKQPAEQPSSAETAGLVGLGEYQELTTRLDVGDMLLGYSNALTECRDSQGRTLGMDGLLNLVRPLTASPASLAARLLDRLRAESPDNLVNQDATLLLCQATKTPVTWRDHLLAPWRLLRPVSDTTKIA